MKLFLLASMASCAAASFMKPNFSHLLEKGRRLQTEESSEDDDDDGPNCNGPEDCSTHDFCALPEKSSSYNLRRRLFADFKGYEGYCSDPKCMASSPIFYQLAASGQLEGENFMTSMRDQGGCDPGGIADQFFNHATNPDSDCSPDDRDLIEGFKSLGCSYSMACDFPSGGGVLPTAEFCSECEGPLLDFLNLHKPSPESLLYISVMCQCPGFAAENLLESSTGNVCAFVNETPECQDMIRALMIQSNPDFDSQTGLCACNGEWDFENPDWCGLSDLGTMCEEAVRDTYIAYFQASVPNAEGILPTYDEASAMYEGQKSYEIGNCGV